MASYSKFQSDNAKHKREEGRTDIYNPAFNSSIKTTSNSQQGSFEKNIDKWVQFVSWCRHFPDLFFDLISPEYGGIKLDLDQRIFLRCLARFVSVYGVYPRGYGKTFLEVLFLYHTAIFYPDIELAMTAQTKENASRLLEAKHREILKFYPLLANEIKKASFAKESAEVVFTSGGRVDILANQQSSKGARRRRLVVEESALLNNELFQDVLEPICNVPRRTVGKLAIINPEELNGQLVLVTTSGFRGSDEFQRSIDMVNDMINLNGKIVLGASWELAVAYGRGETKSQILAKKEKASPIFFAQNYESIWTGSIDGALVPINKLMDLRTIPKAEFRSDGKSEYILSMDVARSESTDNNQSSIAVLKIKRIKDDRISRVQLVNLFNIRNGLTFSAQTVILKKIKNLFNAKVVIVDSNGLGSGLVDECVKDTTDTDTGESLGCWKPMNTEQQPESDTYDECLFDLKATGINHDIILSFINAVESKKLQLLEKRQNSGYDVDDMDYFKEEIYPYIQTDLLIEEIANLKLKQLGSGKYTVEKVVRRIDKDRYSALAYALFYIKTYMEEFSSSNSDEKATDFLLIN